MLPVFHLGCDFQRHRCAFQSMPNTLKSRMGRAQGPLQQFHMKAFLLHLPGPHLHLQSLCPLGMKPMGTNKLAYSLFFYTTPANL